MITFVLSLVALVLGYFIYGRFVERVFGPDDRPTPALAKADGVDFMVLPSWKIFMIQFLNIAGTGPIFGAIMGAKFGPSAYLWIVLGCIFAGATHDYLSGMLSMRNGGANLPEIIGKYLGNVPKQVMLIFSVFLLMMVGAVFVYSPASLLQTLCKDSGVEFLTNSTFWIVVIFVYYIIATMMPIDKIIGKVYPLFAFSLLFMAVALMAMLFVKQPNIPELCEGVGEASLTAKNIFPCLFITIACGAISGFHATQSPLMARCVKSEKMGRPIFYGAMITEGLVALIWATVAMYFFYNEPTPGYQEMAGGESVISKAPGIVNMVCENWLGVFGSSNYQWRHGAALSPSYHCRLHPLGAEEHPQAPLRMHPYVYCCHCPAHLADGQSRGLRRYLELVWLEQSDALCLHPLGYYRLSGACPQELFHHADSSPVYDHRLHHLSVL